MVLLIRKNLKQNKNKFIDTDNIHSYWKEIVLIWGRTNWMSGLNIMVKMVNRFGADHFLVQTDVKLHVRTLKFTKCYIPTLRQ